jgi:hypothetical protein
VSEPGATPDDARIASVLAALAAARGPGASFCPSEAARLLAPDPGQGWRRLMPAVRRVAARMQDEGRLAATRRGRPVRADAALGPIRLSLPRDPGQTG